MTALTITGMHIDVTEAIRSSTESHFKKLNDRYDCISQRITFSKVKNEFEAHAEYHTNNGTFHANAKDENFYQMIKSLSEKLERQLSDKKNSLR